MFKILIKAKSYQHKSLEFLIFPFLVKIILNTCQKTAEFEEEIWHEVKQIVFSYLISSDKKKIREAIETQFQDLVLVYSRFISFEKIIEIK